MRNSIAIFSVIVLFGIGPTAAAVAEDRCEDIHARLTATFGACPSDFSSPIGLCSAGTLDSFFERATTRFRANGAAFSAGLANAPQSTLSYDGDLQITDRRGQLTSSEVGLEDTANGVFSEISHITGGTGHYAGASGTLFISGYASADGLTFTADVTGKVCR